MVVGVALREGRRDEPLPRMRGARLRRHASARQTTRQDVPRREWQSEGEQRGRISRPARRRCRPVRHGPLHTAAAAEAGRGRLRPVSLSSSLPFSLESTPISGAAALRHAPQAATTARPWGGRGGRRRARTRGARATRSPTRPRPPRRAAPARPRGARRRRTASGGCGHGSSGWALARGPEPPRMRSRPTVPCFGFGWIAQAATHARQIHSAVTVRRT